MTKQTEFANSLGGSPAGFSFSRLCSLTLAAILFAGGAVAGFAQAQPDAAKPAKKVAEKKPAEPTPKIVGGYMVHQSIELGGNLTRNSGSSSMWATMINETTGMRVVSQSLELHSVNTSKTPFFDTLSTSSFGYGGEPNDVSYLKVSKGRLYDFTGSFRRDRNYFDYNLLSNSLLSTATAATPVLVPEPDSLHLFNTVRRNTDTLLTLFPISRVSFRAGYNHNVHEGPTFTTLHGGGDVQLAQDFRNAQDTFIGGVDVKLAKRTTLSYDQFFAMYKGDSSFGLAPTPFTLSNATPVSLGVDVLTGPTVTCGSGANKTENVVNGVANPYCSGTTTESLVAPTRTLFPTEQLRFSTHYWDKLAMNGRVDYSGATSTVNSFNETFIGIGRATGGVLRQEIETGAGPNGQFAKNQRINVNGDYNVEAELNKHFAFSDSFRFWDFRVPGYSNYQTNELIGPTATTSMLTPLTDPTLTPSSSNAVAQNFLNQKNIGNTILGIVTVTSQFKFSAGWRFNDRHLTDTGDDLLWHQNGLILGGVMQPSHALRINVNYDSMNSKSASSATPSDSYTREMPNTTDHLRGRVLVTPAKWINFAISGNDFWAKNTDPLVNHSEHNQGFSFATQITPNENFSLDFNYSYDDVFSRTDLCYIFTPNPNAPLPPGAVNAGTCVPTDSNPTATSNLYLGNGYYDAPTNFVSGAINYAPTHYLRVYAGARVNNVNGHAEMLNPLMVPGALQSSVTSPFADVLINIAPQWSWHANYIHHGYSESGGPGPAARNFNGDVVTLSVKYAF
jgi:hypothetical protein